MVVALVFAVEATCPASAFAANLLCPKHLASETSPQKLPLTDAQLWEGLYQLSIEDAQEHRNFGPRENPDEPHKAPYYFWGRWTIDSYKPPLFLVCRYGTEENIGLRPQIILPIPTGTETCEMEVREKNTQNYTWDVRMLACKGPPTATWAAHLPERPSRATERGGFSLTTTRAEIQASVLARGGTVTAETQDRLRIRVNGDDLIAYFPPNGDRPKRIVTLLPPRQGDSLDTYFSLVLRFGTIWSAGNNLRWQGRDNVWVLYKPGRWNSDDPQEIHLIDGLPEDSENQ
jgi:hypothetical protein